MTNSEIEALIKHKNFPEGDQTDEARLHETHISYVILTDHYAFKMKKPLKFSFLDFSSLDQRKFYCEKELVLNRRLASVMYLEVLPVTKSPQDEAPQIGGENGEVIDYALMMKRMDNELEMDKMLAKKAVNREHMEKIAVKISNFHKKAEVIDQPFVMDHHKGKFNDFKRELTFIEKHAGNEFSAMVEKACNQSDTFLEKNQDFMAGRNQKGMIRDGHGDLHSHNIFLYQDPVIFDCIEFNDKYRQVDLLSEIAFFCMDLEYFGEDELSQYFYENYTHLMPEMATNDPESYKLFTYYKSYRANVRAKVTTINAREQLEEDPEKDINPMIDEVKKYIKLMDRYWGEIDGNE